MTPRRAAALRRVSSLASVVALGVVRKLAPFAVPEGVIVLVVVIALRWEGLQESVTTLARVYPSAVLAAGLLLGWRFHRSRLLLALLVLALADRALLHLGGGEGAGVVYGAVALLLPLNLTALAVLPERGALSLHGLVRVAILLAQAAIVFALAKWTPWVAAILELAPLPRDMVAWTPVTQPAVLAFGAALGWLTVRVYLQPVAIERGFLWALVVSFLALNAQPAESIPTIYLATAGLVLIVAVVETSYHMAYRDGLTGLPARRALNEALHTLSGRYTVAMVDVDHFKKFNDRYGHDIGDQVLRMVAAQLVKVRGGAKVFRYGGEEFAVLFPGKAMDETAPHLEGLRSRVEKTKFTVRASGRPRKRPKKARARRRRGKKVAITVSIGAAERASRDGHPDDTIRAADEALYRAKRAGRNRVKT